MVKSIDVSDAKLAVKQCQLSVREYVQALERSVGRWEEVNRLALAKIRELTSTITQLEMELANERAAGSANS